MGGVIWDLQHSGKPSNMGQRGAHVDLDGDGVLEDWEKEAELTPFYVAPATRLLALRGHFNVLEAYGEYSERHKRANELARMFPDIPWLYIGCHLNAGGGRNAQMFFDGRSSGGALAASSLANEVGALPELLNGMAYASWAKPQPGAGPGENEWRGDTSKHWTWGAWSTIAGIYAGPANLSAVCVEPFFLDRPEHQVLATGEGAVRVGEALARGIAAWLER